VFVLSSIRDAFNYFYMSVLFSFVDYFRRSFVRSFVVPLSYSIMYVFVFVSSSLFILLFLPAFRYRCIIAFFSAIFDYICTTARYVVPSLRRLCFRHVFLYIVSSSCTNVGMSSSLPFMMYYFLLFRLFISHHYSMCGFSF